MLYISVFEAKERTSLSDINRERDSWFKKGRDKVFQSKCSAITRYEVLGGSPLRIFFVIDTDDPTALHLLTRHFGNLWDAVTYPVLERELVRALEEDHAIVAG